MSNYYWNYTDCIWSDNLEAIELALTRILEQEGCCLIPQLPQPPLDIKEKTNNFWYTVDDLWIVGLFPGATGWTIVKTSPPELLCGRAVGATRSRLSELAMQIGRDAFHMSVYWTDQGILMEADAHGRIFISGSTEEHGPQDGKFHEQQINDQENSIQFFLLQVPEEIQIATKEKIDYEEWERKYKELKVLREEQEERVSDPQSGLKEMEELFKLEEQIDELLRGDFQIADEALGQLLGGPYSYWDLKENLICDGRVYDYPVNLVYKVYTQQQQLEAQGARLLYFQPAEHYRQSNNEAETNAELELEDIQF